MRRSISRNPSGGGKESAFAPRAKQLSGSSEASLEIDRIRVGVAVMAMPAMFGKAISQAPRNPHPNSHLARLEDFGQKPGHGIVSEDFR